MTLDPGDLALLHALRADERDRNGVPTDRDAARRRLAWQEARRVMSPWVANPDHLRVSILGPEWSSDIDAHVAIQPSLPELHAAGWLPLDRLGYPGRWAVVHDGEVVGGVDVTTSPRPAPLDSVLSRCRRRREVRIRELLELRVLKREGVRLPAGDVVVAAAAAAEEALGGDDLAGYRSTAPRRPPVRFDERGRYARRLRSVVARVRRSAAEKHVIAFSGVDGSGKSSLTARVHASLEAAGVPADVVWARPGMNLGPLGFVAKLGRRAVGQGAEPGVRAVASGTTGLPSRRGMIGALWVTIVGLTFLVDVRRQHASARGTVLYDRHLPDALVTLEFVYGGARLGAARWLSRFALPRAEASFYVDVDVDVAVSRKPGDSFGAHAVRSQLGLYERALESVPAVRRLEGTQPLETLVATVLRSITSPENGR